MDFHFKDSYPSSVKKSDEIKSVPENTLLAYVIPGVKKDVSTMIRPCRPARGWMDATPGQYAYRCIPLSAANTMGWEILNPVDVELSWSGADAGDRIDVRGPQDPFAPHPHFGSGTVTWYIPFLFRTPPEYGLMVTGPANQDKAHIVPLDAFVRTDWVPFPFTMNWRITTPEQRIHFAAGEPICRVLPYPLELLNETKIELHDLEEDPAFMQAVNEWGQQRQSDYQNQKKAESEWAAKGHKPSMKELWNSRYAKGSGSADSEVDHQTVYKCADVIDKRKKS